MYAAMLATPLRVVEVLGGHLAVIVVHLGVATAIFVAVAALFGAFTSWWVLLAVPVGVLTGMAFAVPTFALAASIDSDDAFSLLYRFVVTPLMLFSGTFFPIDQLPLVPPARRLGHPAVARRRAVPRRRDRHTTGLGRGGAPLGAPRVRRRGLGAGQAAVHPEAGVVTALQAATRASRRLPFPAGAGMARHVVGRNVVAFRRAWLLLLSGFVEPVFYLFSLGVGIGSLVGTVTTDGGSTVSYAAFVAPALLAASAMNGAVFDATFNVFFKLRYQRLYDAMLATPHRSARHRRRRDHLVAHARVPLLGDVPRRRCSSPAWWSRGGPCWRSPPPCSSASRSVPWACSPRPS